MPYYFQAGKGFLLRWRRITQKYQRKNVIEHFHWEKLKQSLSSRADDKIVQTFMSQCREVEVNTIQGLILLTWIKT